MRRPVRPRALTGSPRRCSAPLVGEVTTQMIRGLTRRTFDLESAHVQAEKALRQYAAVQARRQGAAGRKTRNLA
jgi:hypothetical protein